MQQLSDSKVLCTSTYVEVIIDLTMQALDLLWLVGNQAGVNFEYFKRLLIAIRQKKEVAGSMPHISPLRKVSLSPLKKELLFH